MRLYYRDLLSQAGYPSSIVPDFWFMLTLAIVLASLLTLSLWRRAGGEPGRASDLLFWGIFSLFVGTKLFYFLQYGFPRDLSGFWHSHGFALYGGLAGLLAAWGVYYLIRSYRLALFLDCVTPSLALGVFLGRIGCFLAGCNGGEVTSSALGVRFPEGTSVYRGQIRRGWIDGSTDFSLPAHPTQLYESLFGLIAFLLLLLIVRKKRWDGQVFVSGMLGYAIWRFLVEFIRADAGGLHPLGLTFSQFVSLCLLALALGTLFLFRRDGGVFQL